MGSISGFSTTECTGAVGGSQADDRPIVARPGGGSGYCSFMRKRFPMNRCTTPFQLLSGSLVFSVPSREFQSSGRKSDRGIFDTLESDAASVSRDSKVSKALLSVLDSTYLALARLLRRSQVSSSVS